MALTTVFRQLGDDRMTAILNEIREGVLLGHARSSSTPAPTRLRAARRRVLADAGADQPARDGAQPAALERLPGDEMVHHAEELGDLSLFDPPVEETLRFKVGAQVMMLNNDQGDRWVNGTLGRVVGVDYDRYGAVVESRVRGRIDAPTSRRSRGRRRGRWSTAGRCAGR